MILSITLTIFVILMVILLAALDYKHKEKRSELKENNLNLRIENESLIYENDKIKRFLKEIEKTVYMNNYNNKDFQLRKLKEILAKCKY